MTVAQVIGALAAVGCVFWLVATWYGVRVRREIPRLAELHPAEPAPWPRLSVVVPARNEEATAEAAGTSLLAEDYPELEIVLVNDRSEDRTGEILDALAARDPRARVLHVTELPDGWLGKNHALHRGAQESSGDWLLFTDADVHFEPGCLRRAVAWAEENGIDHLALFPDVWSEGFLLDCAVSAFGRSFMLGQKIWAVADPKSKAFVGVGAFNLVRRSAFERTEGFPWLKLDVVDDVALGKLMKSSGMRCAVLSGTGLVGVTWYGTLGEIVVGLEKNTYAAMGCRLSTTLLVSIVVLAMDFAPLVALFGLGIPGLPLLGVVALVAGLYMGWVLARWTHRRVLPSLLFPLGTVLFAFTILRAGIVGTVRGGVRWRGTFYPSKLLRREARVRFL